MEQSPEKYLIKLGRISDSLKDLQRKVSEYPQIQVCRACDIMAKKTGGCNCSQRCFITEETV